jgi:hypothetical protein
VSKRVKRKRKLRPRTSDKAIDAEGPPHWTEKFSSVPTAADVESLAFGTSWHGSSAGHISDLRSKIEADPQLSRELTFFIQKTGWSREEFLWLLWDGADIMHIEGSKNYRRIKEDTWPLSPETVESLLKKLLKVKKEIEQVNASDFSPTRTEIYGRNGQRLPLQGEQALQKWFRLLPDLLASYREVLSKNFRTARESWPRQKKSWQLCIDLMRQDSLYWKIFKTIERHHSTRLLRLVNAARTVQGRPAIDQHAFDKWLSEFKKRSPRRSANSPTAGKLHKVLI